MKSNSEKVREFSYLACVSPKPGEANGNPPPNMATPMTEEKVLFLSKMILDELVEFLASVLPAGKRKASLLSLLAEIDERSDIEVPTAADKVILYQADALTDVEYYMKDTAARHGIDLDRVFALVHEANMSKVNPATGLFGKRLDGKVLKPIGWKPADLEEEIYSQMSYPVFER